MYICACIYAWSCVWWRTSMCLGIDRNSRRRLAIFRAQREGEVCMSYVHVDGLLRPYSRCMWLAFFPLSLRESGQAAVRSPWSAPSTLHDSCRLPAVSVHLSLHVRDKHLPNFFTLPRRVLAFPFSFSFFVWFSRIFLSPFFFSLSVCLSRRVYLSVCLSIYLSTWHVFVLCFFSLFRVFFRRECFLEELNTYRGGTVLRSRRRHACLFFFFSSSSTKPQLALPAPAWRPRLARSSAPALQRESLLLSLSLARKDESRKRASLLPRSSAQREERRRRKRRKQRRLCFDV